MPVWYEDYFELKAIKTQQTQETLYLSLNCLKEFRQRAWSKKRVITRDTTKSIGWCGKLGELAGSVCPHSSLCPVVSAWHDKHLFTKLYSSHLPVNDFLPDPYFPCSWVWHISPVIWLSLSLSYLCEIPVCMKLIFFFCLSVLGLF